MIFDVGLTNMIEDKRNVRALTDHLNGICHLNMGNANVKAEVIIGKNLNAFDEARLKTEFQTGFVLDNTTHSFDQRKLL